MNQTEKVARWLWLKWIDGGEPDIEALEVKNDPDWADCLSDADELLALREPSEPVDIVFDGPPGPESGRFVEVESPPGKSIKFGEWLQRDDGYWVLRINALNPPSRDREALEGVTVYQCTNGDLYILTNENLVGAVHHFYQPFPEHAEQFGPLKPLTILGAEDER